jgi:UDPglucose 6-dehydrogenase
VKVLVIGVGFVGLTTASVLASLGINVMLDDTDEMKLTQILNGELPFFESGLGELLETSLSTRKLERYEWDVKPDLTFITVGTPSLADGSIDLSFVKDALQKCNTHLPSGSLVAIKSTVIPGTTRALQEQEFSGNLELLMIPEFLREGSAVNDAMYPDRTVIGARSKEIGLRAASLLGISSDNLILTSTFSAESIKYASNAFLATCISFTNEVFSYLNHDIDYRLDDILAGWHADKRLTSNNEGKTSLTQYLIPGPGFGGSCFPKDLRALQSGMKNSGNFSPVIDGTVSANENIVRSTSQWVENLIPDDKKFLIMGMAFKDGTNDMRESPSLLLSQDLVEIAHNGFWIDQFFNKEVALHGIRPARIMSLDEMDFIILMHHSDYYRELIKNQVEIRGSKGKLTILAMRNQKPIDGTIWLVPRQKLEASQHDEP